METNPNTQKKFDAVKYMRQERDRISKDIKDMTTAQRLEYFKKKSKEFRKKGRH